MSTCADKIDESLVIHTSRLSINSRGRSVLTKLHQLPEDAAGRRLLGFFIIQSRANSTARFKVSEIGYLDVQAQLNLAAQ